MRRAPEWSAVALIRTGSRVNHVIETTTVTVARVDPTATKLLVLKGTLVGSSGWDKDLLGCSVEAVIKPPPGAEAFLRRRMIYGNHLQWVYGDYSKELKTLGEMLGLSVELFA
ncbi:MAG: hypothetical protein N2689_01635, partial [Verrucomicrobiae bacterium]|nr:hypothetical protein [Verrucomicrobiae bacterium]